MSTSVTTIQQLSEAIAAASDGIDERARRIAKAILNLLANGDPVTHAEIAARAHEPEAVVLATLKGWPAGSVFWDDELSLIHI